MKFKTSTKQVFALNNEGKLDEAISLAEKIVEMENKSRSLNAPSYSILLDNLIKLKDKRIKQNHLLLNSDKSSKSEQNQALKKMKEDARYTEKLFNAILSVYKNEIKTDTVHLASVKRAFASFLNQYDQRNPRIEQLYSEAMTSYAAILGEKNENNLFTIFELSRYYFDNGRIEESIPLFEKYIQIVEKNYGKESKYLVPVLRYYTVILLTIDSEDEAKKRAAQISGITGEDEPLDDKILDISSRSPDSRITIRLGYLRNSPGRNLPPETLFGKSLSPETLNEARLQKTDGILSVDKSYKDIIYTENSVKVLVDENGKVLEAKSMSDDDKYAKKVENAVLKWKFKPIIYQGKPRRLRGVVLYKDRQN